MADEGSAPQPSTTNASYLLALLATGAVFGVRLLLEPYASGQSGFLLFALAIIVGSWIGGLGPGLLATVVSSLLVHYFFLVPSGSFAVGSDAEVVSLTAFLLQGTAISALGESRLRHLARLHAERAGLEVRIAQRTAELSEANSRLERSNEELEGFASIASHDLQEPLRKIRAFGSRLDAAAGPALDPASRDYLDRMLRATTRMQQLIDDLLTWSRVGMLVDLEHRVETSGATVRVHSLPDVTADALQMYQLFLNLIGNALKFGRPDTPLTVDIRGRVDDRHICIEVEDNGIGFEPRYASRIFGLFQRLHARGVYDGTGLGLALCRRIVDNHGGTIAAVGRPGEGALLRVTLPKEPSA